jgi:hypothetical protein
MLRRYVQKSPVEVADQQSARGLLWSTLSNYSAGFGNASADCVGEWREACHYRKFDPSNVSRRMGPWVAPALPIKAETDPLPGSIIVRVDKTRRGCNWRIMALRSLQKGGYPNEPRDQRIENTKRPEQGRGCKGGLGQFAAWYIGSIARLRNMLALLT